MKKIVLMVAMVMVLGMGTLAQATLIDRGGGLIYDTDLDITWLTNNTGMLWADANTWAETLVVNDISGWRLPTTPGTHAGYTNEGEMGHLYYDELGNTAGGALWNRGPFTILQQGSYYWSGSEYNDGIYAWIFFFGNGYQAIDYVYWAKYPALAVHSGDVGGSRQVPEPASMLLFSLGLLGLAGVRRKLKK